MDNLESILGGSIMQGGLSCGIDGINVDTVKLKQIGNNVAVSRRAGDDQRRPADLHNNSFIN